MNPPAPEAIDHSSIESIIKHVQHHQNGEEVFRFPHPIESLKIIETHISWVILTGKFAYKLKKPVQFDFVDYSNLCKRQTFCHREIELNRRYAPEIYLDVCPIYNLDGQIVFGEIKGRRDSDRPIEYAVKMREFPQSSIAREALPASKNAKQLIEQFGRFLADFHSTTERADPSWSVVDTENIVTACRQNFEALQGYSFGNTAMRQIDQLHTWTEKQLQSLETVMRRRLDQGLVRRCHGDLHLSNIVLLDDKLIPFDGIEFNPQFHWIDTLSEVAFVVMDLFAHQCSGLGWRFLNAYLDSTGKVESLEVLRFYLVYRSLVRAKITVMQLETGCEQSLSILHQYIDTAHQFAFHPLPQLTITFGFSGSGKSTEALSLIDSQGGIRIRSDLVRMGLPSETRYEQQSIDEVYSKLYDMTKNILSAGYPVVVDATFLKKQHRDRFLQLSQEMGIEFNILRCEADFDELTRRIQSRQNDPSEATLDVLKKQIAEHDPLNELEQRYIIG